MNYCNFDFVQINQELRRPYLKKISKEEQGGGRLIKFLYTERKIFNKSTTPQMIFIYT